MIVPGSILYVTSLWAIKIALVLFYKRLAAPGTKLQMIYNITLGLLVIFWATIFFHIIFQCFPHDKRWSQDPNCVLSHSRPIELKLTIAQINVTLKRQRRTIG
jgi:heme/copper-type cytochrome/quinol oxidase subunit 2